MGSFIGLREKEYKRIRVFLNISLFLIFMLFITSYTYSLTINIISPENEEYNTNNITILATISSPNKLIYYNYTLDTIFYEENINETNDTYILNKNVLLEKDGEHSLTICGKDVMNESSCKNMDFSTDTTPPSIILTDPNPGETIYESQFQLRVLTSEKADCYYSSNNISYESMETIDGLDHKQVVIFEEGEYTYYFKCIDKAGNVEYAQINFVVNLPPKVTLSFEENPPLKGDTYLLKAGVYTVALSMDQPVKTAFLSYSFNDESTKHTINLISNDDGTLWKGYLLISEGTANKVGVFHYSVSDYDGISSSGDITMFLVDTYPPSMPDTLDYDLEVINETHKVKVILKWHESNIEEVKSFNIYRKDKPGVTYTDILTSVDISSEDSEGRDINVYSYIDEIEAGKTYYYRISAVDKAGNEGTLSQELKVSTPEIKEEKRFSDEIANEINDTRRKINVLELNIEDAIDTMEELTGDEGKAVSILGLLGQARGIKNKVNLLLKDLDSLDPSMEESVIKKKIEEINKKLESYDSYPRVVEVRAKKSWIDESSLEEEMVKEQYALYNDINKRDVRTSDAIIRGEAFKVVVSYGDGQEKTFVVVRKTIPDTALDIVEYIPKTFVEDASLINFNVKPRIIKSDPILLWKASDINNEIVYYIEKESLEEASNTKTFLFGKKEISVTGNMVKDTGSSFNSSWIKNHLILIALIISISGLGIYYLFFLRPAYTSDEASDFDRYYYDKKDTDRDFDRFSNTLFLKGGKRRDDKERKDTKRVETIRNNRIQRTLKNGNSMIDNSKIKINGYDRQYRYNDAHNVKVDPFLSNISGNSIDKSSFLDTLFNIKDYEKAVEEYNKEYNEYISNPDDRKKTELLTKYNLLHLYKKLREAYLAVEKEDIVTLSYLLDELSLLRNRMVGFLDPMLIYRIDNEINNMKKIIVGKDPLLNSLGKNMNDNINNNRNNNNTENIGGV